MPSVPPVSGEPDLGRTPGYFTSTMSATPTFLSSTVCRTTKRPAELWSSKVTVLPMTLTKVIFLMASLIFSPSVHLQSVIAWAMMRMAS